MSFVDTLLRLVGTGAIILFLLLVCFAIWSPPPADTAGKHQGIPVPTPKAAQIVEEVRALEAALERNKTAYRRLWEDVRTLQQDWEIRDERLNRTSTELELIRGELYRALKTTNDAYEERRAAVDECSDARIKMKEEVLELLKTSDAALESMVSRNTELQKKCEELEAYHRNGEELRQEMEREKAELLRKIELDRDELEKAVRAQARAELKDVLGAFLIAGSAAAPSAPGTSQKSTVGGHSEASSEAAAPVAA
ncbi:hypothetical protein VTO73DRAFT_3331 [Trametes versicolor]